MYYEFSEDIENMEETIEQYRTMVFRIAFGYVKNVHDADDIAQDVFLKLFKKVHRFESEENRKAWLIRVTVNTSKTLLTSIWKTRRSNIDDIPEGTDFNKEKQELFEYVEKLKPKYRTIIYLYYYEDYSIKEIAEILKIRQTTVTTQLARARGQLKEIILEEGYVN
jgi:RNA polymerase sigma-70 factor (ECF subfamily)